MKRCLQHKATDNRNKNRGKQHGIAVLCALSLCVALGSFTVLSAPAIAVTEDAAQEIGIVEAATPESATAEPTIAPVAEPTATPDAEPTATPIAEPTATPVATAEPAAATAATPESAATPTATPVLTGDMSCTLNKVDAETGEETPDATITLTCTEAAGVPADAQLAVRELEQGSDEYNDYYDQTVQALAEENGSDTAAITLDDVRFFDVTILVNGEKFEPAAPVQVKIEYATPVAPAKDADTGVVHFAEEGTELLTPEVAETEEGVTGLQYEQSSFSIMGVYRRVQARDAAFAPTGVTLPTTSDPFTSNTSINITGANVVENSTTYKTGAYNPTTGYYEDTVKTSFKVDFSAIKTSFDTTDPQSYNYYYDLPDDIAVPDSLCSSWNLDEKENFYYRFNKDADGNAYLMVHYIPEKVNSAIIDIPCYVKFDAELGSSYLRSEGENPVVNFGDQHVTVHVDPGKSNHTAECDVAVAKSGSYVAAADEGAAGGYLYYTVDVTSIQGTDKEISLSDKLTVTGSAIEVGAPVLDSVQKIPLTFGGDTWDHSGSWNESTPVTNITYSCTLTPNATTPGDPTDFTMTLPQVVHNTTTPAATPTRYRVTYKYPIINAVGGEVNQGVGNSVSATDEKVTDNKTTTVTVTNEMLKKTGSYSDGKVTWTITVNPNHADIAGFKLSDDQLKNAITGINVKNNATNNAADTADYFFDQDNSKITFNAGADGKNTNSYTITYTTATSPTIGGSVTNDVNIVDKDDHPAGSAGVTVGVTGGSLAKAFTGVDNANKTMSWTSTLTVPEGGMVKGTVVTDILTQNTWDALDLNHYMTPAQVKATYTELITNLGGATDATFEWYDSAKNWHTSTFNGTGDFTDAEKVYGFRFTTGAALSKPADADTIALSYSTTFDPGDHGNVTYGNNIAVDKLTANATHDYLKPVDKAGLGSTLLKNPETDCFYWRVQVALDPSASADQKFTVIDTMPQDVLIDTVYFGADVTDYAITSGENQGKLQLEVKDNKIVFGEESGGTRTSTGVTPGNDADSQKLILTADKNATITKAESGQQVITIPIDASTYKAQTSKECFYVVFKCKLDTESIDDTWTPGTDYEYSRTNSVVVKKSDDAEYGSSSSERKVTVNIPEVMPLAKTGVWDNATRLLTYTVLINPSQTAFDSNDDGKITLVDKLSYYFTNNAGAPIEYALLPQSVKLSEAKTDGSGGWLKDTAGTNYDTTGTPITDWGVTFGTSNNGYGQYYSTITASVPDAKALVLTYQYRATNKFDTGTEYIFYGMNPGNTATLQDAGNKQVTNTVTGNWQHNGSSAGSDYNSYTINKVETGKNNVVLSGAEFTLYKYDASNTTPDKFAPVTVGGDTKIYTTDANGKITIAYTATDFDEDTSYYLVESKAPTGYELPESPPRYYFYFSDGDAKPTGIPDSVIAVNITKGSAQTFVENEKDETPSYTLPETGGVGTTPYLFGGLALLGAGALGLTLRKKRERGRQAR